MSRGLIFIFSNSLNFLSVRYSDQYDFFLYLYPEHEIVWIGMVKKNYNAHESFHTNYQTNVD